VTRISVVVVARDEAAHLPACLASAHGADEIIVVDHGSRDATSALARAAGARVAAGEGTLGALRAHGLALAGGEWVLSLDADERIPPGGLERLRDLAATAPPDVVGFRLPFRTWLGGRPIRWGGYSAARVRLYRRAAAAWDSAERVHERVRFPGGGRVVRAPVVLEHHSFRDLAHARAKYLRYAAWAAADLRASGRRPSRLEGLLRATWRFVRCFFVRGAFLMGRDGLALSCIQSLAVWRRTVWTRDPPRPVEPEASGHRPDTAPP
jgi:glycosyltransferase involved in cell wall biosynthesis